MNRAHLWRQNRIAVFKHLFRKFNLLILLIYIFVRFFLSAPHVYCRNKAAHTYSCSTEVIYFIYFQNRIEFVCLFEYFTHLIGCNRIKTAAERIQLNKFHIISAAHKFRRRIKARMINPLVVCPERSLGFKIGC